MTTQRRNAMLPVIGLFLLAAVPSAVAQVDPPEATAGATLFRTHCAPCHGSDARGAGPVAGQFRRLPPSLTTFSARNRGVFPSERLRRIIDGRDVPAHGNSAMPAWGDAFSRDGLSEEAVKARIDAIVKYLEGIQVRKSE